MVSAKIVKTNPMKKNFFQTIHTIIVQPTPQQKFVAFKQFYEKFTSDNDQFEFSTLSEVEVFTMPSYSTFCDIVDPKEVPQRKKSAIKSRTTDTFTCNCSHRIQCD